MAPRKRTRRASGSGGRGKKITDLVVVFDSQEATAEFRAQCEVVLPLDEARNVVALVTGPTRNERSLARAATIVRNRIHSQATATFRQIIELAFSDQLSRNSRVRVSSGGRRRAGGRSRK
jgi:hypothetical protein